MAVDDAADTRVLDDPGEGRVRAVDVVVVDGADRGKSANVGARGLRVGTGAAAGLRLDDPAVSRLHCDLSLERRGVRIVDGGSTNGTFVDGMRVRDADVYPGVSVRIGTTTLRIVGLDDVFDVPISSVDRLGDLVGASVAMRRIYAIVERVAPTDATVLIRGETGTGKDVVARELHARSVRARGPFVAVDCGAIAPALIESELFGHARGAFSGALADRRGLLEEANGGTLFLDEIGELPIAAQAKLLRALEAREVRRVGTNAPVALDVRVLAATNRPLSERINEGTFREELYYRLAVVEMVLPPLRTRREDIPELARRFFDRFGHAGEPLPPELLSTLLARSWPGNVRELRNFIERCLSLGVGVAGSAPPMPRTGMPPGLEALVPTDVPLKEARDAWTLRFEEAYVRALFAKTGGNVTRAAAIAGVSRRFLQRTMVRLGLRVDDS